MPYDAKRTINGTFGALWLDGEYVCEVIGFKAEVTLKFKDVPMCGDLAEHRKYCGRSGKGSIEMNKINSRMAKKLSEFIKAGKTPTFILMSNLKDPDAAGAERVVLQNCIFDSLTLADWAANELGKTTQPFTFTDWEYLDMIEPTE